MKTLALMIILASMNPRMIAKKIKQTMMTLLITKSQTWLELVTIWRSEKSKP